MIEALSRIFFDAGFSPSEALIAIDTCGLTILGMTTMHAASLTEPSTGSRRRAPPVRGRWTRSRRSTPTSTRMLAASAALDADLEFERAMRALAEGLLALHADGALAPPATATGGAAAAGAAGGD